MSDKISNYERTRMMNLANIEEDLINEFKADLKKQCVMLMGLPAAGKSTFINSGTMGKYVSGMKSYKVSASDVQVKALQYDTAKNHFNFIQKNVKNEDDLRTFSLSTSYVNPWKKAEIMVPITWKWWKDNKEKGLKNYYNTFRRSYYDIYFDIRDLAQKTDTEMFHTKIKESGNLLVIDTTGSNFPKAESRFKEAHNEGFNNVVIFLEIDPKYSIARDQYRRKNEGRSVGENAIYGYVKKLEKAFAAYQGEVNKENGFVDRVIYFRWSGGSHPLSGDYKLVKDMISKRDFEAHKKKIKK